MTVYKSGTAEVNVFRLFVRRETFFMKKLREEESFYAIIKDVYAYIKRGSARCGSTQSSAFASCGDDYEKCGGGVFLFTFGVSSNPKD